MISNPRKVGGRRGRSAVGSSEAQDRPVVVAIPGDDVGRFLGTPVRSSEADISKITDYDRTVPPAGNRDAFLGQPYYRRTLFETTVYLRNLQTVAFTYPSVYTGGGSTAGFNPGGG